MNAIEISNLTKVYNKPTRAIDNFSLSIPLSSIFGIAGPNGAGKSTLMNILAGILKKTSGNFTILEQRIKNGDYEYKREVGFVLEKPHYIKKISEKAYRKFFGIINELQDKE